MADVEDDLQLHPLPWTARSSSIPGMPGPGHLWLEQLSEVLSALAVGQYNDPKRQFEVRESSRTLELAEYANQLAPSRLLVRTPDLGIQRTPYATRWLVDQDPEFLARVFHRHIRYVGELLAHLIEQPLSAQQIAERANLDFRLGWKGLDPVRRRVRWLSLLGFLVEHGANEFALTDAGLALLESIEVQKPLFSSNLRSGATSELQPASAVVSDLLETLATDPLAQDARKHVLAYIPTLTGQTPVESLRMLTSAAVPEITAAEFENICKEYFGVKASSAGSALTTMRTLGLYEPAGRNRFTASSAAREWLETGNDVDLIRIVHAHLRFVGEILVHVDQLSRAAQLHRLALAEYGLEAASPTTAKVVQLLRTVGLIAETGYAQYESTPLGRQLAAELPMAKMKSDLERAELLLEVNALDTSDEADLEALIAEIGSAGTDSQVPTRFEKALAEAFDFLGLETRHVGGAGSTDVIVGLGVASVSSGRAIVDAKSSASGLINEKMISFQALKEHKSKHEASHVAVVGPGFPDGRLRDWAIDEGVALITSEQLTTVLRRQLLTPLAPEELIALFDPADGWTLLEQMWMRYDRRNQLLGLIVACFVREAQEDDPLLGSSLDVLSIYRAIRDQVSPKPDTAELQAALDFLSSPFVSVIAATKGGYELRESPKTSARRLRALGVAVSAAE